MWCLIFYFRQMASYYMRISTGFQTCAIPICVLLRVIPGTTDELVRPVAALQLVVASVAFGAVGARAAVDGVVAGATADEVVAGAAGDHRSAERRVGKARGQTCGGGG